MPNRLGLAWQRIHQADLAGTRYARHHNPPPIQRTAEHVVEHYARLSLNYAGRLVYTETRQRSELFHRNPGDFKGAHADCSQFAASIYHWAGVKTVTDTDYTGTLWNKGKVLPAPALCCLVIFGPYTGAHAAIYLSDMEVIGFGEQTAPDSSTLAGLQQYFAGVGKPGVRFIDLLG